MTFAGNLDLFIGQDVMRRRLQLSVDAALLGDAPLPHLLFCAPHGMGKATLTHALANSAVVPVHAVYTPGDLVACFRLPHGCIALIERIHDAPRTLVAAILGVLRHGVVATPSGTLANPAVTIVGTTAAGRRVDPEIYQRLVVPRWVPYSAAEMTELAATLAAHAGLVLAPDMLTALGRAASSTPRCAAALVGAARSLVEAEAIPTLNAILEQAGFFRDGLTDDHLRYLALLRECRSGATPTLLSAALCLPPEVCTDLERILLNDGLIELTNQGRHLTGAGARRLDEQMAAS